MAITLTLEEWTTITGPLAGTGMTQAEDRYLDVSGIQDLVIYPQFTAVTLGGTTMTFESSPTKDEALFFPITALITPGAGTPIPIIVRYSSGSAANPPASRFLRWRVINGTAAWSYTMRIIVAGNPNLLGR